MKEMLFGVTCAWQGGEQMQRGVLFVGHGTRLNSGVSACLQFTSQVARVLKEKMGTAASEEFSFSTCFLELQNPSLMDGIEKMIFQGITHLIIAPILLFAAGHAKNDIPHLLSEAKRRFPEVQFYLTEVLGVDQRMIQAVVHHLLVSGWSKEKHQATVVFVGRGSKDADAYQAFLQIVDMVCNKLDIGQVCFAFLAGYGPRLEDVLPQSINANSKELYVVPYLLFEGRLSRQLPSQLRQILMHYSCVHCTVHLTELLGHHPQVIDCMASRVLEVLETSTSKNPTVQVTEPLSLVCGGESCRS